MTSTAQSVDAGHIIPASCLTPTKDTKNSGQVHPPIRALMFDHLRFVFKDKYANLEQIFCEENGLVNHTIPFNKSLHFQYDAGRVFLRSIKGSKVNRQYLQFPRTIPKDPLRLEYSNDIWGSSRTLEDGQRSHFPLTRMGFSCPKS